MRLLNFYWWRNGIEDLEGNGKINNAFLDFAIRFPRRLFRLIIYLAILVVIMGVTLPADVQATPPSKKVKTTRLFKLGTYKYQKAEYKQAIKYYKEVVKSQEDHWKAYFKLGQCYMRLMDYRTAAKYYSLSIKYNEDNSNAYNNRGNAFLEMGKYARAISDYNMAIHLNPTNGVAYNNRGAARIFHQNIAAPHRRDILMAMEDFQKAMKYRKDQTDTVYLNMGISKNMLNQFEEAIRLLDKAYSISSDNWRTLAERAYAHLSLGNFEAGEADMQRAVNLGADEEFISKLREKADKNYKAISLKNEDPKKAIASADN